VSFVYDTSVRRSNAERGESRRTTNGQPARFRRWTTPGTVTIERAWRRYSDGETPTRRANSALKL
jgi:hypothetical protein